LLVTVGAASTGCAFCLDGRRSAAKHRLLAWLRTERPTECEELTSADRFMTIRAVEMLRRSSLAEDEEFRAWYRLTNHGTRFAVAMILAGSVIGLLFSGPPTWDGTGDALTHGRRPERSSTPFVTAYAVQDR